MEKQVLFLNKYPILTIIFPSLMYVCWRVRKRELLAFSIFIIQISDMEEMLNLDLQLHYFTAAHAASLTNNVKESLRHKVLFLSCVCS